MPQTGALKSLLIDIELAPVSVVWGQTVPQTLPQSSCISALTDVKTNVWRALVRSNNNRTLRMDLDYVIIDWCFRWAVNFDSLSNGITLIINDCFALLMAWKPSMHTSHQGQSSSVVMLLWLTQINVFMFSGLYLVAQASLVVHIPRGMQIVQLLLIHNAKTSQ